MVHEAELIEYYTPAGADVKASADQVRGRVPQIRGIAEQVERDHRSVLDTVAGDLQSSMANAPNRAVTTSNDVTQKAEFAAGCLELFYTQGGGTTWGDMFQINEDYVEDPEGRIADIVESGYEPDGSPENGNRGYADYSLDLDRLLHHEERHSRQWASHILYAPRYGIEHLVDPEKENEFERDAGLNDGGYVRPSP